MTHPEIARRRLHNQLLSGSRLASPAEVVRWLGAVQSQDYAGGKWAVAQRCAEIPTAAELERALDQGSILRTHVLRPTWHFIYADDARWMLALTGPRVLRGMASRHRELQLDETVFEQCHSVFRELLGGGQACTRAELESALNQAGISTHLPQRFPHILMQAELAGLLTSGAWRGKQNTYALLAERAPNRANDPVRSTASGSRISQSELTAAVEVLALRYFTSHGPATLKDFAWWSGLTLGDARSGVAAAGDALAREEFDGQEYFGPPESSNRNPDPAVHLLPNYDEYVVAYADRSAIFDPRHADRLHMRGGVLNNIIVSDGLVIGGWSRELKKDRVGITARPLEPLTPAARRALEQAAHQYAAHLGLTAETVVES